MAKDVVLGLKDGIVIETTARNAEICRLYMSGLTMQQIAEHFKISIQRVQKILSDGGVNKADRKKKIKRVRDAFIGIETSEADKAAVCAEALRQGLSISELTAEWIHEKLEELKVAS